MPCYLLLSLLIEGATHMLFNVQHLSLQTPDIESFAILKQKPKWGRLADFDSGPLHTGEADFW